MGFRVLFIRESEKLQLYPDNIKIHRENDFVLVPIGDLQMLIIDNYSCVMSAQLINKLTENAVSIVLCGLDHLPKSTIFAINGHHASSGMLQQQIHWDCEMKEKLTQYIVQSKIMNQVAVLGQNNCDQEVIDRLIDFATEVEQNDRTNREGLASKMYFRELFGKSFIRFSEDPINAGLDYGYAIFRSMISTLLVSKGLLPNLGIFHRGKQNSFNLSDDIIEVFRPLVDHYVFNHMLNAGLLTYEHRKNLIDLTTNKIEMGGKYYSIPQCIIIYIDIILKCFESNDIENFFAPKAVLRENV